MNTGWSSASASSPLLVHSSPTALRFNGQDRSSTMGVAIRRMAATEWASSARGGLGSIQLEIRSLDKVAPLFHILLESTAHWPRGTRDYLQAGGFQTPHDFRFSEHRGERCG